MRVWRNSQVLYEQTSDPSTFLNALCLKLYTSCEQNFSYLGPVYPTSALTLTVLSRVYYTIIIIIIIIMLYSAICHIDIQGAAEQIKRFGGVNTRAVVVVVGWCTWSPSALSFTPFQ
jgi:hypothetical protein